MALGVLIEVLPFDPQITAVAAVRAASHDDARITSLNGLTWWPSIARLPTLTIDLFDGGFGGEIGSGGGEFVLSLAAFPNAGRYIWADAAVRIYTGNIGDAWGLWTLRFSGRVSNQPGISGGQMTVSMRVDDRWMDTPLLAVYGGTGGSDGPAAWKGKPKPLAIGAPKYVSADLVDATNNVVQISGYGAINGFTAALDRLSRFPAALADYASYAALVAATIPAGCWASCNAVGMARTGAPPAGILSFLVQGDAAGPNGWARLPGQIMRRLALIAGASVGQIDDTSLNALDTAVPYNHSLYLADQTTAREQIQSLAASVNAGAGVSWQGKLFACRVAIGGAAAYTLRTDGTTLPIVARVEQLDAGAPFWRWATEGDRCWTVHGGSDIAYALTPNDRGLYNAGTTYRAGDVVWLGNGSQWQYINGTPASGHYPPDPAASDAWWQQFQPARASASFVQATPPASSNSLAGQTWIDSSDPYRTNHIRIDNIVFGGYRPIFGGTYPAMRWIVSNTYGTPPDGLVGGTTASALVDQANIAAANATAALAQLTTIAADSILDRSEKSIAVGDYNTLLGEQSGIDTQATALGITTEKTAYDSAMTALGSYLTGLSPAYNDYSTDTPIVRATFLATFQTAYNAKTALLNKMAAVAATTANWGGVVSRPVELTDGRVAAGLDSSGNVNTGKVSTVAAVANAFSSLTLITPGTTFGTDPYTGSPISYTISKPSEAYMARISITGTLKIDFLSGSITAGIELLGRYNNGSINFADEPFSLSGGSSTSYKYFNYTTTVLASDLVNGQSIELRFILNTGIGGHYNWSLQNGKMTVEYFYR